jgi:nitrate/nitrite-specific signal transduction histidine kinase
MNNYKINYSLHNNNIINITLKHLIKQLMKHNNLCKLKIKLMI